MARPQRDLVLTETISSDFSAIPSQSFVSSYRQNVIDRISAQKRTSSQAGRAQRASKRPATPQAAITASVKTDNCHCPACRLLIGVEYARAGSRAGSRQADARRKRARPRVDARDVVPPRPTNDSVAGRRISEVHGSVAATRTVCLLARRRLGKEGAGVLRSGSETVRRSTTATVQGKGPFC
jgi:hypothetical protein